MRSSALSDQQAIGLPVPSTVFLNRGAIPFELRDEFGISAALNHDFDPVLDPVLYVRPQDSTRLLRWGERHADAITSDDGIPLADRTAFVHRGLMLETWRLFHHRARFRRAPQLLASLQTAASFFAAHPQTLPPLLAPSRGQVGPVARAASTGLFATALALTEGDPEAAQHALLAGIVADVGVVDSHRKLMTVDRALTPPERNIVAAHPVSSARLLGRIGIDDPTVGDAVIYHHERIDGSGYPSGLPGHDIPRLAQQLALADAFVDLTIPRGTRPPLSAAAAIQQLFAQPFDEDLVALLRALVETPEVAAA